MNAPLALSPDALAAISVPEGVIATPIVDRPQWLALRRGRITASAAAALFGDGVHPYTTAYRLWAEHSGLVAPDVMETPAMKRGRLLEPVHLQLLREEFPTWNIQPNRHFYAHEDDRIGATPDFIATRPDKPGFGNIQGKSVGNFAFKKGWTGPDGDVMTPLWIGIQNSVENALNGASWGMVSAMSLGDGGLDLYNEDLEPQPNVMRRLRVLVVDFFRRVADGRGYEPDYGKDAAIIAQIYRDDDGSEIDLSGSERIAELIAKRDPLKAAEKAGSDAKVERDRIDTELRLALGNAARGRLADGRIVEAKVRKNPGYTVEPFQFRPIIIKAPKSAKGKLISYAGAEP